MYHGFLLLLLTLPLWTSSVWASPCPDHTKKIALTVGACIDYWDVIHLEDDAIIWRSYGKNIFDSHQPGDHASCEDANKTEAFVWLNGVKRFLTGPKSVARWQLRPGGWEGTLDFIEFGVDLEMASPPLLHDWHPREGGNRARIQQKHRNDIVGSGYFEEKTSLTNQERRGLAIVDHQRRAHWYKIELEFCYEPTGS